MNIFETFTDYYLRISSGKPIKSIVPQISLFEGGGSDIGKFELLTSTLSEVREYAEQVFKSYGRELDEEIPDFNKNFKIAQNIFSYGYTLRKDMPAIEDYQVKGFKQSLEQGRIDIFPPWSDHTDPNNPFPEGLSGEDAKLFLMAGLLDGSKTDDKVDVFRLNETVKNLKPIQRQVYIDKNIKRIAEGGSKESRKFLSKSLVIASIDNFIIDGHHRFLTALLIDPTIKLKGIRIDLDINKLKDIAVAYGDAIGNKRNL